MSNAPKLPDHIVGPDGSKVYLDAGAGIVEPPSHPAYRLSGGEICRQAMIGERWLPLSTREANALLARLNGR